jgi:hypothetical protein
MTRNRTFGLLLLIIMLVSILQVHADDRSVMVIGPRVGASYIMATRIEFDDRIQQIFPDAGREYLPVLTQFGVNFEQRIRLGGTQSHFVFQEVLLFGGLDQNFILPSLSTLIGFRSYAGLEFGLGPNFSITADNDVASVAMSVVYAVGWTFSFQGVFVPVNIAIIPTPKDGHFRLTLLSGFNFKVE